MEDKNYNAVHPEKQKLTEAVDRFAHDIKMRLYQKVDEGYTGWDGEKFKYDLAYDMEIDARGVESLISVDEKPNENALIDIAVRAMFLSRLYNKEGDDS